MEEKEEKSYYRRKIQDYKKGGKYYKYKSVRDKFGKLYTIYLSE